MKSWLRMMGASFVGRDDMMDELRKRVINIVLKSDNLRGEGSTTYQGHPDQCFGATSYAQSGEDLIIANLFLLLGIDKPSYLDVGGNDPWHCSNTALLYKRGSRGVVIEANPDLIDRYKRERPNDLVLNLGAGASAGKLPFYRLDASSGRNTFSKDVVDKFVTEFPTFSIKDVLDIPVMTLNQIVDAHCDGVFPQYLSIDVEGLDQDVLQAATFTDHSIPCVISVEMLECSSWLRERGFVPYSRTWCNGIYLREDLARKIAF